VGTRNLEHDDAPTKITNTATLMNVSISRLSFFAKKIKAGKHKIVYPEIVIRLLFIASKTQNKANRVAK
jgi:hypothetical protein